MQNSNLKGRALIASIDLVALATSYGVQLKKEKGEFVGLCPFHADNNPSFFINPKKSPQLFCCTPCSMGGNALEFVVRSERARGHYYDTKREENAAAYRILENGLEAGSLPRATYIPLKAEADITILSPVPPSAPPPMFQHGQLGLAAQSWTYRNAAGQVIFYTARFNKPDGGKDVLPLSYVRRKDKEFWKWQGQDAPRPLYGLDLLAKFPGLPVLVVEGEKTADAANKVFAGALVAITWPGGFRGVRFADWSPLAGRSVLLWPDADLPGFQGMFGFWKWKEGQPEPAEWKDGVAQFIEQAGAAQLKAVLPAGVPEGWDIADGVSEGWDRAACVAYLRQHTRPAPVRPEAPGNFSPIDAPEGGPGMIEPEQPKKPSTDKKKRESSHVVIDKRIPGEEDTPLGLPFRVLGYRKNSFNQNEFWIYSYKAKQALCFSASKFTKTALLQLADEYFWESRFTEGRAGYETKSAEFLMNLCYKKYFNPDTIRGVGAWIDEGRVVVHAGTHIVAEGKEHPLADFRSEYLYEANRAFGFKVVTPLKSEEAERFATTVKLLSWERPVSADLFIGWCVVAAVCGALNWRPHIWLTGPAGSGKTTAMDKLKELVGRQFILPAQGNTTEAAIRQSLNQDARPVSFDEADSDGFSDTARLQNILALVRASSSHDGGSIIKGGSNGHAQAFVIRSCFAFASITPKVANAADKGRVSVLSLVAPPVMVKSVAEENWAKIEAALHECFTPERCEALRARTLSLLPELLKNAAVFKRAATVVLGESRAGDQLGTLLAGRYSLSRRDVISFEDAKKWIAERNWDELRNEETDELMLLSKIMEQPIRVRTAGGVEHERTVGELVLVAAEGREAAGLVDKESARDRVGRIGIRVEEKYFYISNTADWLQKTLRGTAWATNHGRVLVRLAGAEAVKTAYFGPGVKNSRAVKLPISILKE